MLSSARSKAPSMLSITEHLSLALEKTTERFLLATISDQRLHVRFLNLLSMLEHIGSRKIMLSQMDGLLTQDILKHLAEEARHAFFFKREAEKLAPLPIHGYVQSETMCKAKGRWYFGRLDAGLNAIIEPVSHPETGYLLVSLIIEFRAIWLYTRYQKAIAATGFPLSLKSLIAEEDNHMVDMVGRLEAIGFDLDAIVAQACTLENSLFEKLLFALVQEAS